MNCTSAWPFEGVYTLPLWDPFVVVARVIVFEQSILAEWGIGAPPGPANLQDVACRLENAFRPVQVVLAVMLAIWFLVLMLKDTWWAAREVGRWLARRLPGGTAHEE